MPRYFKALKKDPKDESVTTEDKQIVETAYAISKNKMLRYKIVSLRGIGAFNGRKLQCLLPFGIMLIRLIFKIDIHLLWCFVPSLIHYYTEAISTIYFVEKRKNENIDEMNAFAPDKPVMSLETVNTIHSIARDSGLSPEEVLQCFFFNAKRMMHLQIQHNQPSPIFEEKEDKERWNTVLVSLQKLICRAMREQDADPALIDKYIKYDLDLANTQTTMNETSHT